jgi:hypothetical protein
VFILADERLCLFNSGRNVNVIDLHPVAVPV